jgi:hypothetical protein
LRGVVHWLASYRGGAIAFWLTLRVRFPSNCRAPKHERLGIREPG